MFDFALVTFLTLFHACSLYPSIVVVLYFFYFVIFFFRKVGCFSIQVQSFLLLPLLHLLLVVVVAAAAVAAPVVFVTSFSCLS